MTFASRSNRHWSTTGKNTTSKKPRYRNDNGAFFLFVEVRSGGIFGFRCVDKPCAVLTLFPCYCWVSGRYWWSQCHCVQVHWKDMYAQRFTRESWRYLISHALENQHQQKFTSSSQKVEEDNTVWVQGMKWRRLVTRIKKHNWCEQCPASVTTSSTTNWSV